MLNLEIFLPATENFQSHPRHYAYEFGHYAYFFHKMSLGYAYKKYAYKKTCSTILVFQLTGSDYPENWIGSNYVIFSR